MMKKIVFLISIISLVIILPGCVQSDKTGQYTDFVRREGEVAGEDSIQKETVRIYGVYPEKVSTKGMQKIRIYGAGFEKDSQLFLNRPEFNVEAIYINPGTLEVWMPPYHEGKFILGIINPNGSYGRWAGLFTYEEIAE